MGFLDCLDCIVFWTKVGKEKSRLGLEVNYLDLTNFNTIEFFRKCTTEFIPELKLICSSLRNLYKMTTLLTLCITRKLE